MNFLIGRQPIFDRQRRIFAYELLFRGERGDGTLASNQVILDALLQFGLPRVVGDSKAFINFTRNNLLEGTASLLPKERVVIEILEDVEVDDALVAAVQGLREEGYTIALDDFAYNDRWLPLLPLAHIVKLDALAETPETLANNVAKLRPYNLKLLAEKIENEEQHRLYAELGCEYFQGYYLERPKLVSGKRVDGAKHAALMLLAEINKPDADFDAICKIIARDVGLSYKLLRYINSSYFNFAGKVDSISRAVMLLGLVELRRWASLIALSQAVGTQGEDMLRTALTRAKMCDDLSKSVGMADSESHFLAGLMSVLDRLLEMPMDEVLQGLPLTDTLLAALLRQEGDLGEAILCADAYERWDMKGIRYKNLDPGLIGKTFLEGLAWANTVVAGIKSSA
ncbi:EAL and HDOD domain-containing protein [Methylogaea oryzae]|uniref:Histidine kinase n=1 Tax=Methylogaea oryzae TaxID=1295382 RepID=A0A8D5AJ04_9GAMM|nr:HDOD domain-containing protein [Methylogaea oryzae]BBL69541.1 histidine kinase [Methylogaea oryzae]